MRNYQLLFILLFIDSLNSQAQKIRIYFSEESGLGILGHDLYIELDRLDSGSITISSQRNQSTFMINNNSITELREQQIIRHYQYDKKEIQSTLLFKSPDTISISCTDLRAKYLSITSYFKNNYLALSYCKVDSLTLYGCNSIANALSFFNTGRIRLGKNLNIYEGYFKKLQIEYSKISKVECHTDTLIFLRPTFLKNFHLERPFNQIARINLGLDSIQFSGLIFNCQNFKYNPTLSNASVEEAISNFNFLKDMQRKMHYEKGYEFADKDLMRFEYKNTQPIFGLINIGVVKNWVSETWWDYGYNKGKVIFNSLILMFIFLVINLFAYDKLLQTYRLETFIDVRKEIRKYSSRRIKQRLNYLFYCFMFTCTVFWGIKLDISKMSLKKPFIVILILFQYIIGVVCLAYIANYIIIQ